MGKPKDIANQRFNSLVAIKPLKKCPNNREWIWECLCDCGNTTYVSISKLTGNTTKSCGCFKNQNLKIGQRTGQEHHGWMGYKDLSKSYFNRLQINANFRKISFDLTMQDAYEVFIKQDSKCSYTGKHLKLPTSAKYFGDEDTASLDRIDNSKGYQKDNIQWVCKRINTMKHTMTETEFLDWIKQIYEYKFKLGSL